MRKKIILFCFVILIKNTFSQTYKTEIELNELKKKEIIPLILEAFNNIEKNEKIKNISLESSENIKYLTKENNELKSNIVKKWKNIIHIQASLTDLKIEKEKIYTNDSNVNTDILNVISMMKQNGYLLSESISKTNTYISEQDWLKLIQVGKKYAFQGFCKSNNSFYIDATFKVSQENNMFGIITENEDNTKLNGDKSKNRTITEMERLSDNIFKFTFSDGSICNNIFDYDYNSRRSAPNLFNGKTENNNIYIYFKYSPYSGLLANGMRLIAK